MTTIIKITLHVFFVCFSVTSVIEVMSKHFMNIVRKHPHNPTTLLCFIHTCATKYIYGGGVRVHQ